MIAIGLGLCQYLSESLILNCSVTTINVIPFVSL